MQKVGGGLAKWFKKYAIILIPGTFFTILTVDIVNNVNHRNFIEKLFPSYGNHFAYKLILYS